MIANSTSDNVRFTVIDQILSKGETTVPSVAGLMGLSTTTIAKNIELMLREGIIQEIGMEETPRKGRRAKVYAINKDSHYFIGIDVRNSELVIGLIDFMGNPVLVQNDKKYRFENTYFNLDLICKKIKAFIKTLDERYSSRIVAAGFMVGGRINSSDGTSASIFNFEETQDTPLSQIISDMMGMPVFIENNTKGMAYAEYMFSGKQWQNALYINADWGIGMCIFTNGSLYYGSNGYSGEFGHMPCYDNNIICHCGKIGCLETEISVSAIARKLREKIIAGAASMLSSKIKNNQDITENDILEAAEKEDSLCIDLISETGRELGKQLAGMINLFNPERIIIGGKLCQISPFYFLQQVAVTARQRSLRLMSRGVQITNSTLGESAGIIGGGLTARKMLYGY